MNLYSTNNKNIIVDLKEAVLNSLAKDKGLYMPVKIPRIEESFFREIENHRFQDIAFKICSTLFQNYIPEDDLKNIIDSSLTFPAPIVPLNDQISILELFHGPSLAFKDFGAQFMARLMAYFTRDTKQELLILVATSGDTGGAVAAGFHNVEGIQVAILYPSGKVSPLQEKQLTTLGGNIMAFEIDGSFDDCQDLVKQAFLDPVLSKKYNLSSANSINIARLIPQSFYYVEAYKQTIAKGKPISFVIPSGNFGNLTAGLLAKNMGLPVKHFIAATNSNNVVPTYLNTGKYDSMQSVPTLSNAMDVGNPSNFVRMMALYGSTWNNIKNDVLGFWYSDDQTKKALKRIYTEFAYLMDPHGAVGFCAAEEYAKAHPNEHCIILETAHASKFKEDVENILNLKIDVPLRLAALKNKEKVAFQLDHSFSSFKEKLQSVY